MNRNLLVGLVSMLAIPVVVDGQTRLNLSRTDLDRLGVDLQLPQPVAEAEVASGLATVVIPPSSQAIVTSTVSGVLSRVLVAEGDFVSAGQALAEIRSVDLLRLQREFIEAAMTRDLASAQSERDQSLFQDGIIAERRVLQSDAERRAAASVLQQYRQQLSLAGMDDSDIARLLETHQLNPDLTLKAPFAATVVDQQTAMGVHVDAMDPVYRIADLSELWLELQIPQERAERVEPGMRIAVEAGDRELSGAVSMISRVTNEASQTVVVRGRIDDEDGVLRAGQVLAARILSDGADDGGIVAVPGSAIVRHDGVAYAFGVEHDEVAVFPVDVLGDDGILTYIHADLGTGTRVAIGGVATLKSVWLSAEPEGEQ